MTPTSSAELQQAKALTFPVLSDPGNAVARTYGLVFTLPEYVRPVFEKFGIDVPGANGEDSFELPVPATYVIDQDGTIRWAHVELDYRKRAEPADLLVALDALTR